VQSKKQLTVLKSMTATQRREIVKRNQNKHKSMTDQSSKQSNLLSICERTFTRGTKTQE